MARPSKGERKRLSQASREQERAAREAALPLSHESLMDLRGDLSREFDLGQVCDHSCRLTREWLGARAIPEEPVLDALLDLGAACDCEVLANVQPADIFGVQRAPASMPPPRPSKPKLPSAYEDRVMALTPQRPWRIVQTHPGVLLTLRLGKSSSGPTLSLLDPGASSNDDLVAWCRARWESLHRRRWQRARGETDDEAAARAVAEWSQYEYSASPPTQFSVGDAEGVTVTVSSPRRTDAYQWWILKLPSGTRALEFETEPTRVQNDRRAVHDLIASVTVK